MVVCHICAEDKPKDEFKFIPYFTKYKKHDVIWCRYCQKMWLTMKKEKERVDRFIKDEAKFTVSFE
jgi:hypothetical protein